MASLRVFMQVGDKHVRFRWEKGSRAHVRRVECPLLGGSIGRLRPGCMNQGHTVELVLPSGEKSSWVVVGVRWNERNSGDPLLLFSRIAGDSEFTFSVLLMRGADYSCGGCEREWYIPWFPSRGIEQLVEDTFHVFFADRTRDVVLPDPEQPGPELPITSSSLDVPAAAAASSSAAAAAPAPAYSPSAASHGENCMTSLEMATMAVVVATSKITAASHVRFQ